ncbi:MAG: CBS domain-containing protein [Deltaproteobacteria bacterium]|nr:CBS domain-containing protein [Deltaproteobacteria bacterium]
MQRMEPDEREEIELLRTFGERTAGALMSTDFVTAAEDATAADALRLVREHAEDVEMLHYVFCHDGAGRLTGVVSLKALVLAPPETVLKDLFGGRLVFAKPDDGIAAVAEQFYKYNFLALPVVGEAEKLLGIITFKHSFDELVPYYHRQAA